MYNESPFWSDDYKGIKQELLNMTDEEKTFELSCMYWHRECDDTDEELQNNQKCIELIKKSLNNQILVDYAGAFCDSIIVGGRKNKQN